MITKYGVIKRVNLGEYRTRRTAGLFAINLDEGDELLYVLKTEGESTVLAASSEGLAIHFDENDVRAVGRQARGVRMMTLPAGVTVVGAAAIPRERDGLSVLTVTERGFGKRTDPMDFTIQNRGGKGMPYVMAILDDLVTGITAVPVAAPEETAAADNHMGQG